MIQLTESISSIDIGLVPRAAILRPLSCTVSSRRNFNQAPFANLCRTTLVRVPERSLTFFACLTSMFAPGVSVEMIKFVTFTTCHVTTNGSPFSRRYPACLRPWEIVSVIVWTGYQTRSRIQQHVFCSVQACDHESPLGWFDHVDEPGVGLLRRLTANGIREVHRNHLLHRDGARHGTNHTRSMTRLRGRLRRACRRRLYLQRDLPSSFCTPPSCVPSSGSTCIHLQTCQPFFHLSPCPCALLGLAFAAFATFAFV